MTRANIPSEQERRMTLLIEALQNLRTELRSAIKLDVKKHYSLMVADAAAGTAIAEANIPSEQERGRA